jgi:glycosyltransferase involved in cell wall biosynthesis
MSQSEVPAAQLPDSAPSDLYGPEYYKCGCGPIPYQRNSHWLSFFGGIADEIVRSLKPNTVFDAGCAWGFLVESFRDRGVEAYGVDVSPYAIGNVRPDMRSYCSERSLVEPIKDGPYDLVTCIEVLEHMPEADAREAIGRMTSVTNAILFSSTPDDFNEPTHVNVHPVIYWLKLLAGFDFYPDVGFDASFLAPHAFLLRKSAPVSAQVLVLFSETLRLRGQRASFLTRHGRIEQLETELDSVRRESAEASSRAAALQDKNLEMKGFLEGLSEGRDEWVRGEKELIALRNELAVARFRLGGEETIREQDEMARLKGEITKGAAARQQEAEATVALQSRLEDSQARLARSESLVEEWMAHSADLSKSMEVLSHRYEVIQTEKESLYSSPGWQLLVRYREWLRNSRVRHPWVSKYWEPALLWALRRMKVSTLALASRFPRPATALQGAPRQTSETQPRLGRAESSLAPPGLSATSPSSLPVVAGISYEAWIRENEPDSLELQIQRRMSATFSFRPLVSVLMPVYKVPVPVLRDTIDSVFAQTYDNWELCVTVPAADNEEGRAYLEKVAREDQRVRLQILDRNEGISGNSNQALNLATGEFLALLDHDDQLAPFALFEVVQLLNQQPDANFIYSDKDQITEDGSQRLLPLFKPEWSPEIMLNANYLTHLCVMRTAHVREIGGWRAATDGAQDWDLFLRVIHRFGNVKHIPKVLYHWRQIATSVASQGLDAKPYAAMGQVGSVASYCQAIGLKNAEVKHAEDGLRIAWPTRREERVSIVYLSAAPDHETLRRAAVLLAETAGHNFEILVPFPGEENGESPVRLIPTRLDATLLERIDLAVQQATGGALVFVDEAVAPISTDWLAELTGCLHLPDVALAGAKLLDPITRHLRHCGIVFTSDGRPEYIYAGQPEHVSEQAGAAAWYRNWSAVSGACFAIRREVWDEIGGMSGDPLHSRLDIHLSLKIKLQAGQRIVYNPYVRMVQSQDSALESFVRGDAPRDSIRAILAGADPYFNPNLDCRNGTVTYRQRRSEATSRGPDYSTESQVLLDIFDFAPAQIERSKQLETQRSSGRLESVTWFLPEFNSPFYGGVHTILRFADLFLRAHQVRSQFCILAQASPQRVRAQVTAAFPSLAAQSEFFSIDAQSKANNIPGSDVAICTLWTTAYAALEYQKARRKFYFIQDDEALFYPAGSISALVEATYRFGFHGICNTSSLLKSYIARGGEGEYFSPAVDPKVFHDRSRKQNSRPPYTLFCYGRPGHPRNSFELLSSALRTLKQRMGDRLLAISAGAEWDPRDYRLDGVVHNLGMLNYNSTGALYRACDAGVAIMMTRHPSYLPMELMACGALVVTNRNPDTSWLLKDGENCLLSDLSATSLADRIQEGLENESLRSRITETAANTVRAQFSDWDEPMEKIYRYMASLC